MATVRLMSARIDTAPPSPNDDVPRLRVPPHSRESEQSLLGGLLQDNSAFQAAAEIVSEADFYVHEHRLIYSAISDLITVEGQTADLITVFERLRNQGQADNCGGLQYLNQLEQCVPSARNTGRYAEIVRERSMLRRLIAATDEIATAAFGQQGRSAADVVEDGFAKVRAIAADIPGRKALPMLRCEELKASSQAVVWLVKHVIPSESIGILFGGSGTFKSFLALDAALHVCHGLRWLGRKTKQGPVIYIAAEGGAGMWPRIDAWHRTRRIKWAEAPLYVVPCAIDLAADSWRVVEAAQLAGVAPAMVVVDTLSQTFAGEENSANEVAAYLRELGARFRQLWQCAVLVVHHSGHQATERPRGSSAIRANVDFMFGVFRDQEEMVSTIECHKQKDGDRFSDVTFSLSSVELGTDEDGDSLTSLAASHVRNTEEMSEIVRDQIEHGRKGYHALLLELAKEGMKEKDLRTAFYDACGITSSDSRSKAYRRVMEWARTAGLMAIVNGEVRIFGRL